MLSKIVVFTALIFSLLSVSNARVIESIAAIVNNEIITLSDIRKYKKRLQSGSMVDDLLVDPRKVKSIVNDEKALIDLLINEKILTSEVKKQGLDVTVERVEKEVRKISKRNGISKEQLVEALRVQGVNFSEYQNFIKTRIERQSLVEKTITSRIKITDEEISAYYISEHGKLDGQTRESTVAHIFVKKNPSSEEPKNKINLVLKKLKDGSDFDTLASQYSEDENFTQGGILGTFRTGDLAGPLDTALKKLQEGEFSEVVETQRGYHILKIVKLSIVSDPAYLKEKGRIRGILYQRAFKKQFNFWLDKKRREAFIRINKV